MKNKFKVFYFLLLLAMILSNNIKANSNSITEMLESNDRYRFSFKVVAIDKYKITLQKVYLTKGELNRYVYVYKDCFELYYQTVANIGIIVEKSEKLDGRILRESDVCDDDGDGFPNWVDDCPYTYGTLQGCPDSDGDGFNDNTDACPNDYSTTNSGCPTTDSDGDGFYDNIDACPNDYSTTTSGCPDSDGDGIYDSMDACPNDYAILGNGCPSQDWRIKYKSLKIVEEEDCGICNGDEPYTMNVAFRLNVGECGSSVTMLAPGLDNIDNFASGVDAGDIVTIPGSDGTVTFTDLEVIDEPTDLLQVFLGETPITFYGMFTVVWEEERTSYNIKEDVYQLLETQIQNLAQGLEVLTITDFMSDDVDFAGFANLVDLSFDDFKNAIDLNFWQTIGAVLQAILNTDDEIIGINAFARVNIENELLINTIKFDPSTFNQIQEEIEILTQGKPSLNLYLSGTTTTHHKINNNPILFTKKRRGGLGLGGWEIDAIYKAAVSIEPVSDINPLDEVIGSACDTDDGGDSSSSGGSSSDSDGDGIPDDIDMCPNIPGVSNGCPCPGGGVPNEDGECMQRLKTEDSLPQIIEVSIRPNPFKSRAMLEFKLPTETTLSAKIITLEGKIIQQLANNRTFGAGTHQLFFDSSKFPAGYYIYQIVTTEGKVQHGKIIKQ